MTYNSITFIEYSSVKDAIQSTEKHILITLRREEFIATDAELAKLATIEKLEIDIRYWDYSEVSPLFSFLVQLPNLVGLRLEGCKIKSVPATIGKFRNLLFLSLKRNEISELPKELKRLKKLEGLSLAHNEFTVFPEVITEINSLIELDVEHNKLETLPDSICGLAHLSHFDFEYNKIEFPPTFLLKMKELKAVYYSMNKNTRSKHFKPFVKKYEKIHFRSVDNTGSLLDAPGIVPFLKVLSLYIQIDDSNEIAIAAAIKNFINVQQLSIGQLSLELTNLNKLETLSFGKSQSINILDFPITQIKNLYKLHLHSAINQKELEHLLTSKTLRSIYLNNQVQDYTIRYSDIKKLKQFLILGKEITFEADTDEILSELRQFSIKAAKMDSAGLFHLLDKTPNLTYLGINEINDKLDDFSFLNRFSKLEHLILQFKGTQKYNFPDLFAEIKKIKALKEIYIVLNEPYIPTQVELINQVSPSNFKVRYSDTVNRNPPKDWTNMDMALLKEPILFTPYYGRNSLKKANSFISKYANIEISNKGRKILFALFMEKVDELEKLLKEERQIPIDKNSVLFVAGKVTGMTKPEITESCKNANINLAKKFSTKVSHVIVTKTTKYDAIEKYLNSDVSIFSQEELKRLLWEKDTPFLMEDSNEAMNEQIFDLFFSKQSENIVIAIQLLKTGGLNKSTLSLITALTFFHIDKKVRKEARSVFNKFASDSLRSYCKLNWKDKHRKGFGENEFINHISELSEISGSEFKVFISYIRQIKIGSPIVGLKQLAITEKFVDVPKLLFKCPELKYLRITTAPNMDFQDFFNCLSQFKNLEELYIYSNNLKHFDEGIPKLKGLKVLSIACKEVIEGTHKIESDTEKAYFQLKIKDGEFDLSGFQNLTWLSIKNSDIPKFTNFAKLSRLETLGLSNNSLNNVPTEIFELKKLQLLDLKYNHLRSVPIELGKIPRLNRVDF